MSGAEAAVRAKALEILASDDELGGLVHGVFDGAPPRATAPFVSVGGTEGVDWGTKDRAGREVRLTLTLVGTGEAADMRTAARIEACAGALRGDAAGWRIAGARVVRTRFAFAREGGWRWEAVVRCRCLATG